jgi:hypothetical protein
MNSLKVTRAQKKILLLLSRQDISTIRKNPRLVSGARQLLMACKKIIKKIEAIPQYAGRKKRETAHRRIVALARKAIDKVEA